ncbi:MAG: DUF1553 domain-containing protein [Pirellulaceae bacterium]|nr:DUF1553 domain-containing protein [Pirellulaceae bacterium]
MISKRFCDVVLVCWLFFFLRVNVHAEEKQERPGFQILPATIELTYAGSWQTVSVQGIHSDGMQLSEIVESVEWTIEDASIAKMEGHRVVALSTGNTRLTVTTRSKNGRIASDSVPIAVVAGDKVTPWEFRNHVQAVLARNGCNMGACHGALSGKGGFRLSLRGYDATTDHFNITRQDRARRIELTDPARSLFVAKPSGAIEHKGGIKLPVDSHDYRVVVDWIAAGAYDAYASEPKLERVEVLPSLVKLEKGDTQQVIVRAHYDNGRIEDVTHWSKFSSVDESVASVDEHGQVKVLGPGEGAVSVWFASRIALTRIVVPYSGKVDHERFETFPLANVIDEKVVEHLRALGLPPSPRSNDSEFLRRAYITTIATLPTADETAAFLASSDPAKRERLIDQLLERPEFVDYWAYRWSDLLMLSSSIIQPDAVKSYYQWIRGHVSKNTPWDMMVREIIAARGESLENGATNFYAINQDPEGMSENASQAFMGLSIGCAKCHNHPLEKWTNDQYYAMANMFARVRAKGWGGDVRNGTADRTLVVLDRGDLIQPLTGKPQLPAPLDAPPLDPNDPSDRRVVLADWLTSPDNPYFTRAIVNRVWAAYFGIGIVNSVDDLRTSNPASNPALMDALCDSLKSYRYDLKSLMRLILNSETFQRSSQTVTGNRDDRKFFSHYYPKRLMAEVLLDAVVQVAGTPSEFNKTELMGNDFKDTKFYPAGTRAIQLYDSAVANRFLKTFGRNQRRITCECERSDEPSVVQVLHINNGETLNPKLEKKGSNVDRWMKQFKGNARGLIQHAYLAVLCREPTELELDGLENEILAVPKTERRIVIEDLLWSLMSSREFLFVY